MKKSLIVLCLLGVVLAGCMPGLRYPKTAEGIIQKAEISEDPFEKTKWVKFPAIRPNQMSNYKEVTGQSTWNAPVGYFFLRALQDSDNNNLKLVQAYFITDYATGWGFYNSAVDSEGNKLEFLEINRDVTKAANSVNTVEEFAINLDVDYLQARRDQNIIIKVYGKKQNFVFFIPGYYVDGVLKYFEGE